MSFSCLFLLVICTSSPWESNPFVSYRLHFFFFSHITQLVILGVSCIEPGVGLNNSCVPFQLSMFHDSMILFTYPTSVSLYEAWMNKIHVFCYLPTTNTGAKLMQCHLKGPFVKVCCLRLVPFSHPFLLGTHDPVSAVPLKSRPAQQHGN